MEKKNGKLYLIVLTLSSRDGREFLNAIFSVLSPKIKNSFEKNLATASNISNTICRCPKLPCFKLQPEYIPMP